MTVVYSVIFLTGTTGGVLKMSNLNDLMKFIVYMYIVQYGKL